MRPHHCGRETKAQSCQGHSFLTEKKMKLASENRMAIGFALSENPMLVTIEL